MKNNISLSEAIAGYELAAQARRLSDKTIADYQNTFNKFTLFLDEDPSLDEITPDDVRRFLAGNTPRIALGPVVSNMQELRRRADRLSPPDCAYFAKDYLVQYMDYTIEGYLNFMADEPANYKFDEADRLFEKYVEEMK